MLSKPLSRFSIATTKVVVAVALVAVFAALPTLGAGLILSGTTDRLAIANAAGAMVAGTAYAALFVLLASRGHPAPPGTRAGGYEVCA